MQSRRYSVYFPIFFLIFDLVALNLGVFIADYIRFGQFLPIDGEYQLLQVLLNVLWVFVFFSSRLHEVNRDQGLVDLLNRLLTALVINLAIVFAIWFAFKPYNYSRQHLFTTYLAFSALLIGWRSFWYFFIRYYRARGYNYRNVIIVGYGELADDLIEYITFDKGLGYNLIGIFDDKYKGKYKLGGLKDVERFSEENEVDVMFCLLNKLENERVEELIDFSENHLVKVKILSKFSKLGNQRLSFQNFGTLPVINVNAIPLDNPFNQGIKRAFDIVFSLVILVGILSWLIPLIGILIRLESKGPIFFKQYRHGLNNRLFLCWKFRTMVVNKDADTKQATKGDARITRVGAFLRKSSIDEIPQFLNVLLGDMSVVGPRPHPIKLNESFQPRIEKFWQRHAVRPGITGLAQSRGFRGETSEFSAMSGRVKLDRFYVKNWSLLLDLKIIILTVISIIKGSDNAY
jgi:Undecaprenyl-phosphate glucose phosphotransferase